MDAGVWQLFARELRYRGPQLCSPRQDNRALDEILQFPDVARPIMALNCDHHIAGDVFDCFTVPLSECPNEVRYKQWDVFWAFA
jgi:hypothetical protein